MSMSTSLSDDAEPNAYDQPGIEKSDLSRLYIDAFRFGEVLAGENGESPTKFADLVGGDFESQDMAATERFAKLSVNSWLTAGGLAGGAIMEEPETVQEIEEPLVTAEETTESPPHLARTESASQLSDEDIVKVLIDEFGRWPRQRTMLSG